MIPTRGNWKWMTTQVVTELSEHLILILGMIRPFNQFKAFIDICHLYGIAVIADVVYNHVSAGFDDQSIEFFDRQPYDNANNLTLRLIKLPKHPCVICQSSRQIYFTIF